MALSQFLLLKSVVTNNLDLNVSKMRALQDSFLIL